MFVYDEELYDHQRCGVEHGLIRHQGAELRNTEERHREDMSNMSVPEATINITDKDRPVVNHDLALAKTTKVDEYVNNEPLTDLAWSLELSLRANNLVARRFFEKQDRELLSMRETETLGLGTGEKMIYRKTCKRSLDDTL